MKMEQKAAVKAVACRKIKETDKNRLNPVKLCHQNLCQNSKSLALSNLVRTTTLFGGIIISAVCFSVPPVPIAPSCSKIPDESAV
jgi:hypothetical protein